MNKLSKIIILGSFLLISGCWNSKTTNNTIDTWLITPTPNPDPWNLDSDINIEYDITWDYEAWDIDTGAINTWNILTGNNSWSNNMNWKTKQNNWWLDSNNKWWSTNNGSSNMNNNWNSSSNNSNGGFSNDSAWSNTNYNDNPNNGPLNNYYYQWPNQWGSSNTDWSNAWSVENNNWQWEVQWSSNYPPTPITQ